MYCCVADQHHLHASYQVCAEADFFKTERIDPHSKDERLLFKVGGDAQDGLRAGAPSWSVPSPGVRTASVGCLVLLSVAVCPCASA